MSGGLSNLTNVTMDQLNYIVNSSSYPELAIKVSVLIYGGWLYFILLWILWIIILRAAQDKKDQLLSNMLVASGICTVLSMLFRGIVMIIEGVRMGLLTDHQLWVFPIMTAVLGAIIWSIKD